MTCRICTLIAGRPTVHVSTRLHEEAPAVPIHTLIQAVTQKKKVV